MCLAEEPLAIKTRFAEVLVSDSALLAAVTLPRFKLRWLRTQERKDKAKAELLAVCRASVRSEDQHKEPAPVRDSELEDGQRQNWLLHNAVEAAPPKDWSTRFLFLGYLSAYLACIYGHRTGVFTRMTQAEVKRAVGDDQSGYLINVLEHKTVQTYGHAQVYLTAEEYGCCRRWLGLLRHTVPSNVYFFCSFGEGPIKDLRGYMGRAWTDMGLGPVPTFMDIRSAVAT
uniref:Uncharacterized protein n=1 Tax=Knipowitschia caucasica TaxID=637954 RepID=A0AAV2LVI7_KNICA